MASSEIQHGAPPEKSPEHITSNPAADSNPTLTVTSPHDRPIQAMHSDDQIKELSDLPPSYTGERPDKTLVIAQPGTVPQMDSKVAEPTKDPVAEQRVLRRLEDLGEQPDFIDCPYCKTRQQTKVSHPSSSATTLSALFCCLFCGVITVCIPFLCHWFPETDHHCPKCNNLVAHKTHDGSMEARLPQARPTDKYGQSQYKPMDPKERQDIEEAATTEWRATAPNETLGGDVEKPRVAGGSEKV